MTPNWLSAIPVQELVILALAWVIGPIHMCQRLAVTKGYSGFWAFCGGLIFGWLGVIYYAGLPDKYLQDAALQILRQLAAIREGE